MIKKRIINPIFQRFTILWNFIQPNFLKNYFAAKYWSQHKELYKADRAPKIYELAKKKIKKINNILEFGSNSGLNLEYFLNRLEGSKVVGIDVNPIVKKMENRYESYRGYNADDKALNKFKKNEFTLSFTSSVLDHIPDEKIIKEILRKLALISEYLILNEPFLDGVKGDVSEKFRYQVKQNLENPAKKFAKYSYFWDYDTYLDEMNLNYEKINNPTHNFSLGPFYKLYFIDCIDYIE